ncbi:MAG: hypothetical protein WEB53_02680 [Akkermansiaceae bacterium]
MKVVSPTFLASTLAAIFGLASCATVGKLGQGSVAFVQKTSSSTTSKVSELSEIAVNKIRPAQVKVVEVREKDLKELPTGHERALAFQSSRKQNFWFFGGPVDFKEPMLPEAGTEMDGSLLPPKSP